MTSPHAAARVARCARRGAPGAVRQARVYLVPMSCFFRIVLSGIEYTVWLFMSMAYDWAGVASGGCSAAAGHWGLGVVGGSVGSVVGAFVGSTVVAGSVGGCVVRSGAAVSSTVSVRVLSQEVNRVTGASVVSVSMIKSLGRSSSYTSALNSTPTLVRYLASVMNLQREHEDVRTFTSKGEQRLKKFSPGYQIAGNTNPFNGKS